MGRKESWLYSGSVSKDLQKIIKQLITGLIQTTSLHFYVVIEILDKHKALAPLIENWENNLNVGKGIFKRFITVAGVYISISNSNE